MLQSEVMSNPTQFVSVAIQAGGTSSRMGADKALRSFLGEPLITRIIARVSPLADELFIVTNQLAEYAFTGCQLTRDVYPGRGPLGGLYTALQTASHPTVVIVGCDMPFVSASLLEQQCNILMRDDVDIVMPQTRQGLEPFHAVYQRDHCLRAVKAALDAGVWRMTGWLDQVRLRTLEAGELMVDDPQQMMFSNVNTPEEFSAAERYAREHPDL